MNIFFLFFEHAIANSFNSPASLIERASYVSCFARTPIKKRKRNKIKFCFIWYIRQTVTDTLRASYDLPWCSGSLLVRSSVFLLKFDFVLTNFGLWRADSLLFNVTAYATFKILTDCQQLFFRTKFVVSHFHLWLNFKR